MSVNAGLPSWKDLLDQLHDRAFGREGANLGGRYSALRGHRDALWRAEVYRQELRGKLGGCLRNILKRPRGTRPVLADIIASLDVSHYLTTNFDRILEEALRKQARTTIQVIDSKQEKEMSKYLANLEQVEKAIVYLHGNLRRPNEVVLSDRDYIRRYRMSTRAERELFAILSTRSVVFFGFSLEDPAWKDLLSLFRDPDRQSLRHFAVLPLEGDEPKHAASVREYYESKFGITPVFYIPSGKHARLVKLVELLKERGSADNIPEIGDAVGFNPEQVLDILTRPIRDREDPHRGRWGRRSMRNGRQVVAKVDPVGKSRDWFRIRITVKTEKHKPFGSPVYIFVHPTFSKKWYEAELNSDGTVARLTLEAYGAFTIGVACDDGRTLLEYNLANADGATPEFQEN